MNKSATIRFRELKRDMGEVINNASLPCFVVITVLRDLLSQLERIDEEQYLADMEAYQQHLAEQDKDDT